MKKCTTWLKTISILLALWIVLITVLVVTVDPFFQYHAPLEGFPYVVDNQVNQNPGMAENMSYDSIILGSSMTANFNTDWFSELMGQNTLKLTYNGAYPKDISNMMSHAFASDNEIKTVYLGVDPVAYTPNINETKYPVPEYLYDDNIFNDVSYVFNKDVIFSYVLKPALKGEGTDMSTVYHLGQDEGMFDGAYVLNTYVPSEEAAGEADTDALLSRLEENLNVNICPYIEANPDTEFVIFFPPYSILFWNEMILQRRLSATVEEYRYITDKVLSYPNVRIFLFSDNEDIITDLHNYSDYSHYHEKINRYMTECFADGDCELTKENATDRIDGMYEFVSGYDYESLFN